MTNPYGRAMAQMASVFAELERAMIRERTRAAMKVKRGRGERISGHEPFGWDFGRHGKLVENRREQKALAWIRQLHGQGKSLREIAEVRNGRRIKPSRAGCNNVASGKAAVPARSTSSACSAIPRYDYQCRRNKDYRVKYPSAGQEDSYPLRA
jgi:DNA invertase Pin-like site-specific DNA recombinase